MKATQSAGGSVRYCLGLAAVPPPCGTFLGHDGSIAGYSAFAYSSPNARRQVVFLANALTVEDAIGRPAAVRALKRLYVAATCG